MDGALHVCSQTTATVVLLVCVMRFVARVTCVDIYLTCDICWSCAAGGCLESGGGAVHTSLRNHAFRELQPQGAATADQQRRLRRTLAAVWSVIHVLKVILVRVVRRVRIFIQSFIFHNIQGSSGALQVGC